MSHFLALMARMKHIRRWGTMRSVEAENVQEHSHMVAMVAHMLALIARARYDRPVDESLVLKLALYHEAGEVITGDVVTPIKYFDRDIKQAFKNIEHIASARLLSMIPDDLRAEYAPLLLPDEESDAWKIVKAADRICAHLKCVEEVKAGNREFEKAMASTREIVRAIDLPEARDFMRDFAPGFALALDELNA